MAASGTKSIQRRSASDPDAAAYATEFVGASGLFRACGLCRKFLIRTFLDVSRAPFGTSRFAWPSFRRVIHAALDGPVTSVVGRAGVSRHLPDLRKVGRCLENMHWPDFLEWRVACRAAAA